MEYLSRSGCRITSRAELDPVSAGVRAPPDTFDLVLGHQLFARRGRGLRHEVLGVPWVATIVQQDVAQLMGPRPRVARGVDEPGHLPHAGPERLADAALAEGLHVVHRDLAGRAVLLEQLKFFGRRRGGIIVFLERSEERRVGKECRCGWSACGETIL